MKLVIDIPDELYNYICSEQPYDKHLDKRFDFQIWDTVKKGTPLSKDCGRLIDADRLWDSYHDLDYDFYEAFDLAQTIIESDKGSV